MNEINNLIELVKKGDSSQAFEKKLAGIGLPIFSNIVSAIDQSDLGAANNLARVLLQIDDPDIVPSAIGLLKKKKHMLRLTGFQILGRFNTKDAFAAVVAEFLNKKNFESDRAWAAESLGEMGNLEAIKELINVVEEIISEGQLQYRADIVIPSIEALAKLGNQSCAGHIEKLIRGDDAVIRVKAVKILKYLFFPGMFPVLKTALRDPIFETCKDAMDALFYLGVREAVDEFILLLEHENMDLSNTAFYRIYDITGKLFDEDAQTSEVIEWWKEYQKDYKSGICYRLGKPIRLPDIVSLLTEEPSWRGVLIEELRIITGAHFGLNPFIHLAYQSMDNVAEEAEKWWKEEGHNFEQGALYKFGCRQDMSNLILH